MSNSKIDKRNVEDMMGLTAMQQGMLFHYLKNPHRAQYLEQMRLGLSGKVDININGFKEAWKRVVQTNEMLRAVIKWEKLDEPVQVILKNKELPIRVFNLSHEKKEDQQGLLSNIRDDDIKEKVDLTREPLRVTLCILNQREAEMFITFHHIIYDGWSSGIILREFVEAYDAICKGEKTGIACKTKYKEFFRWYRSQDQGKQDEFWKAYLESFDTRTLLPYDKNKRGGLRRVKKHKMMISQALKEQMETCSREHSLTIPLLIYAAWGILLQKYNNSDDIIFGITLSGRTPEVKGIEKIVGLFINTLPLRLKANKDDTVLNVFKWIGSHLKELNDNGYEHSSLTRLKKFAGMGKDNDLFDSIIIIDNYPLAGITCGTQISVHSYDWFEMTNFDLTLQVTLFNALPLLEVCAYYNGELFGPETIQRLASHFFNILGEVTAGPLKKLSGIVMLAEAEKKQILYEFNQSGIEYLGDKIIQKVVEDRARKVPDSIAVIAMQPGLWVMGQNPGAEPEASPVNQHITYKELNDKSNQLAHMLGEYGVVKGSRVALIFPRSIEMVVGVLAILKAGATCIPLDFSHPYERNRLIIEDSGTRFLLKGKVVEVNSSSMGAVGADGVSEITYHVEKPGAFKAENPGVSIGPDDLSFIIYTSGSTGKPKGALLNHWGIVNHTYTKISLLEITNRDIVANNFSINVIASIWQILSPLFTGAKLAIYSQEIEWDPYVQFQRVVTDGVTVIEVIPPVLKAYLFLLDEGKEKINLDSLRKIALTSEETQPFLVNKFYERYKKTQLVDCYGQTECCDDVLHYCIPFDRNTKKVPIGTPSLNTQVLILSHHNQLQPVGVIGEICVSGAGVGKGYWNRPGLTGTKFVSNPLDPNVTIYRTGDLGRWLADGKVEFFGRIDHQVKIRGNRVELREIENQVLSHPAVKEAAVIAREDKYGEKQLHAFVVSDREITSSDIRGYLLKSLPDYMVPAYFVRLEQFPLTPNGKVDRKALAKIEKKGGISSGVKYKSPRSNFERKIRDIWQQLLDRTKIGIKDNFFDLGGDSLLLIKLKSKLAKTFGIHGEISIVQLFNHPTIERQARFVEEKFNFKVIGNDKDVKTIKRKGSKSSDSSSIAVIGISLKVPGAANIQAFWHNLINGIESVSFFNEGELEGSRTYLFIQGNSRRIPAGGIIGDIDLFDADFFGISPREAEIMDPQQRLFLQYAYKALEDAGYVGDTYPGTIGVYAGSGWNLYLLNNVLTNPGVVKSLGEFQTMIGNDKDFLTTRVSYLLNLKGPSLTVQTACSTSLVAVHLAKQALLNRECHMALAGGVSVKVPEKTGYFYTEGGHLSPDGHCRPFDAEAKGTVFGNGIGIVVLKRVDEAVKDRDHIYAVIKGSAINNDGSVKVGFTGPSEALQSEAILAAVEDSGLDPADITYVETHGTGTGLGDPVEISALTRAYRQGTDKKGYCAVGSIKANIGHLDAAAGIIGFIKVVLCLKHKQIPPSINVENLNPMIDFANSPFYVNRYLRDWSPGESIALRRAGVSSLGIGGTNAHVVLEEWPDAQDAGRKAPINVSSPHQSRQYQLLLLSANTKTALDKMAHNLADHLRKNLDIPLADVVYTLQVGRKALPYRQMVICSTIDEAVEKLSTPGSGNAQTFLANENSKTVVFMFPGQGSQYVNMGRGLYETEQVFREHMDCCFEILNGLLDDDVKEILYPSPVFNRSNRSSMSYNSKINQTEIAQPVLFIFEYALSKLVMKWGIKPYAMIGHSIGEYAAACLSGVLALEDALKLVVARGKLMQKIPPGAMLSVSIAEDELIPLLDAYKEISVAAVNSSALCVVSGAYNAIDRFEKELQEKGYEYSRLHTSHAFHSPMIEPILEELAANVRELVLNKPAIPYISNVTGSWISSRQLSSAHYWVNHTRKPVRFSEGLNTLLEMESVVFLEIGPGKTLSTFVRRHMNRKENQAVIDLVRHPRKSIVDFYYLLNSIGKLWLYGIEIDWDEFHTKEENCRISLPTYPFERKRYWLQPQKNEINNSLHPEESIRRKEKVDDWLYIPVWKQSVPFPVPGDEESVKANGEECWLFFLDKLGVGGQLLDQLKKEKQKIEFLVVEIGKQFAKHSCGYIINPQRCDDYPALLEDLQLRGKTIDRIFHLWTLSPSADDYDLLDLGVNSLLYLVKALGRRFLFNVMELWVVSTGLHVIESGDTCIPGNAALLGPCHVISQEYPNIICRSIDIGGGQGVKNLVSELNGKPPERIIAYRGNKRWVQTYESLKTPGSVGIGDKLRKHGVYMIIGGLGTIGLTIAQYLARSVQARLILTSRSAFPGREKWEHREEPHDDFLSCKIEKVKKLEQMGAEVSVFRADIADKEQMQTVVRLAEEKFGTIHGVIHAAGVMKEEHFKLIPDLEREDCLIHFKPKIHGLYVLDELFKDKDLDFCMLTSSLSSILGGLTLYAYSAANSFMDGFAGKQARTSGNHWISINWEGWEKDNLSEKHKGHQGIKKLATGFEISREEAKEIFTRVLSWMRLSTPIPQIVVSSGDLQLRLQQWVLTGSPGCEPLAGANKQEGSEGHLIHKRPSLQNIYQAPGNEVEKLIAEIWQDLLGVQPIGIHDDFFELGGHSLLATKLLSRLRDIFRIDFSLSLLFDRPTIKDVVAGIIEGWGDIETVEEVVKTYREVENV